MVDKGQELQEKMLNHEVIKQYLAVGSRVGKVGSFSTKGGTLKH